MLISSEDQERSATMSQIDANEDGAALRNATTAAHATHWRAIGAGLVEGDPLAILRTSRSVNCALGSWGSSSSVASRSDQIVEIVTRLAEAHSAGQIDPELSVDLAVQAWVRARPTCAR